MGKKLSEKNMEAEGVTVEDGSLIENAVQISDYDFLYRLKAFREGSCYVQDEVLCCVPKLASVQKEQFVMDLCSAPGVNPYMLQIS